MDKFNLRSFYSMKIYTHKRTISKTFNQIAIQEMSILKDVENQIKLK